MPDERGRSCIWAFLLYPESMPDYTWEYLAKMGLPCYVSPLHDSDRLTLEDVLEVREHGGVDANFHGLVIYKRLPKVGDFKKPHYHGMIKFSSKQTPEAVIRFLQPLHVKYVIALGNKNNDGSKSELSWRGYARYLTHRDNPEKAQYDPKAVQVFNAPCYNIAAAMTNSGSRAWMLAPVFDFVRDNQIFDWSFLIDYLRENDPQMYELAFANSGKVREYMKSMAWKEFRLPVLEANLKALPVGDTTTPTRVLGSRSTSLLLPENDVNIQRN